MFWIGAIVIVLLLGVLFKPVKGVSNPRTPNPNPPPVDWEGLVKRNAPATGVQYLVVGAGFLGKRIIHTLLLRGETKITAFDCDPGVAQFYKDEPRVQVVAGDVTKLEEVQQACRGVHTVYSTFAVIKYMERLPHQAAFSERINVGGTRNVCEAALKAGVTNLIYTSSSNVTLPRNLPSISNQPPVLDENSPRVTRENSPNHYGWTKALAEELCLEYNGRASAGAALSVVVVRPCSGIFGHGDRFITQKPMEDGFVLGIRPQIKLDYVYVDNVAYGHLLAEARLRDARETVAGEVFNVTNREPVHSDELNVGLKHFFPKVKLYYGPGVLLLVVAHTVETIQRLFPKLRLGELEHLTPAMLDTCQSYLCSDAKAEKLLGYAPAYTIDQALQKTVKEFEQGCMLPLLK